MEISVLNIMDTYIYLLLTYWTYKNSTQCIDWHWAQLWKWLTHTNCLLFIIVIFMHLFHI